MRDTNGKRLLLQKNGVLRPLTSPECVIRTAFGDQAILVVSACPVPNIENLLIFLSLKQSLVCPSSRSNLFLSPFLVWVTLYHLMLPINHSFTLFTLIIFLVPSGFVLKHWWYLDALAFTLYNILPLKFHMDGERKILEPLPSWGTSCSVRLPPMQWFVVYFRVDKHPGSVLQHFLHVLSHWTGHLAGFLPASLLQGQETDWVKEQVLLPLLSDSAGHRWDPAMAPWSHLTDDNHWLEFFCGNLDPKGRGESKHWRQRRLVKSCSMLRVGDVVIGFGVPEAVIK